MMKQSKSGFFTGTSNYFFIDLFGIKIILKSSEYTQIEVIENRGNETATFV